MTLSFKAFEWRAEGEGGDYSIDRLPGLRFVAYVGKDSVVTVDGKAEWTTLSEAVDACVKHNAGRLAAPLVDDAPARPKLGNIGGKSRQPDAVIQAAIITAVRRNRYITSVERVCAAMRRKAYMPSAVKREVHAMLESGTLVWSGSCLRETRPLADREAAE